MSKLTAKDREALPAKEFAGPDRSYPVPDKSHAANAKARASQAENAGRINEKERASIDRKADKVLRTSGANGASEASGLGKAVAHLHKQGK